MASMIENQPQQPGQQFGMPGQVQGLHPIAAALQNPQPQSPQFPAQAAGMQAPGFAPGSMPRNNQPMQQSFGAGRPGMQAPGFAPGSMPRNNQPMQQSFGAGRPGMQAPSMPMQMPMQAQTQAVSGGPHDMYGNPIAANHYTQQSVLPPNYQGGFPTYQAGGYAAGPQPQLQYRQPLTVQSALGNPAQQQVANIGSAGAGMGQPMQGPSTPSYAGGQSGVANPHQQMGASMSDRTAKTLEKRTMADDFLDHMKPYSYKYKDPQNEPRMEPTGGTYLGVMAQDLEKIPELGHQLILDTPHGKMVDQKTALSASMAGIARLNERVRALEEDVTKKRGK